MTLFSDSECIHSHRVRVVLSEKGIQAEIEACDPNNKPEDLVQLNPSNSLPTLIDRDLVLYDPRVVIEYLDERYPHPPLMPVDPVSKARTRLALYRIETDWYAFLPALEAGGELTDTARHQMAESLTASADVFAAMPYFLSEEYSMLDATLAPLLWRLKHFGVELPKAASSISDYAQRVFERPGFQASLTSSERDLG